MRVVSRLHLFCFLSFSAILCTQAAAQSVITTVVGTEWLFPGNGLRAVDAPIGGILAMGVAVDQQGNLYISDADNHMIMKVTPDGILTVVAGNGIGGYSGDGGPATNASMLSPLGVAVDTAGNVYLADYGSQIRKVDSNGIITTIAGNGEVGYAGDGGSALDASFNGPFGIAADKAGNVYIADRSNHRIRKITPAGTISTVAGNGKQGFSGDGQLAVDASLNSPLAVAVDAAGNLFIADTQNGVVRVVDANGIISTIAGGGFSSREGIPAFLAALIPVGLAVDTGGNVYVSDFLTGTVRKVSAAGIITTIAGSGDQGFSGDGGPALQAALNGPTGVAIDALGNLYIADGGNSRVRRVTPNGTINTAAGNGLFRNAGDGGPAISATLYLPAALAVDASGNFYFSEPQRGHIRKVDSKGIITVYAGIGSNGFSGDGGPATKAALFFPDGIAVDAAGSMYIADSINSRIRKITPDGIINTIAGNDNFGFTGDKGPARNATLNAPQAVAVDAAGNVYIADSANNRIRRIATDGTIDTIAGNGQKGFSGDGQSALAAALNNPTGITVDKGGTVYVSDLGNNRVRKFKPGGTITTIAGNGKTDYTGDGALGINAAISSPAGLTTDAAGNLYFADQANSVIRRVGVDGIITTIAGNKLPGFYGDGGLAPNAGLFGPTDIAFDPAGNLLIADWGNDRIRALLVKPPSYQSAPASFAFTAPAGGAPSAAQSLFLNGSIIGVPFQVSINTADGGNWLQTTPASGLMPGSAQITADPANLAAGSYTATMTVTAPTASPAVRTISVTFTVTPATPAKLAVKTNGLSFIVTQGSAAASQTLTVADDGGGSLDFTAGAATVSGANWLGVSPAGGTVTPVASAALTVTADPTGLDPGTYSGTISVSSGTTGEEIDVPVTLAVSAVPQTIQLTQKGLTFTVVSGGGRASAQSFGVRNIGQGRMSWTSSVATLSGGSWLLVSPASGASDAAAAAAPDVDVSVDGSRLTPGDYYGQVQISAPGASNVSQSLAVVVTVLPRGADPGPVVTPTGLVYTATAGGESPGSQDVFVSNLTGAPINFTSGRLTLDGTIWFVHLPTEATVTPDRATRLVVQPTIGGLGPGIYRGTLTLLFAGGVTRTVNLLLVLKPSPASIGAKSGRAAQACAPTRLAPVFSSLPDNFNVAVGWPAPIEVRVLDDCGNTVTNGSAVMTFTNGDPPLSLAPGDEGVWTATWQARSAASRVTVTATAQIPETGIRGSVQLAGSLRANQTAPAVSPGGIVSAASLLQTPLAPGSLISILGQSLAAADSSSNSLPLPTQLAGTSVAIAGRPLPLSRVTPGRIDAVLPYDLPVNTVHQIVVQRQAATTVPEYLTLAPASPAIFTKDRSGVGQGVIYVVADDGAETMAEPATPASAGNTIVIQCTGLGAVDPPVAAGSDVTGSPPSALLLPSVTIGGVTAPVSYAGLLPGFPGVYEVKAQVPAGVPSGDAVPVVLATPDRISQVVTMAIQ